MSVHTRYNEVMVKRGMQNMGKFGAIDMTYGIRCKWGTDIKGWLDECERLFRVNNVPDEHKVSLISNQLFDIPLIWHEKFVSVMGENVTWMIYKDAILRRFDTVQKTQSLCNSTKNSRFIWYNDDDEDFVVYGGYYQVTDETKYNAQNVFDEIPIKKSLKQEGTIVEYGDAFKSLFGIMSFLSNMGSDEMHFVDLFIEGLSPEIGNVVRKVNPKSLFSAYYLAKWEEANKIKESSETIKEDNGMTSCKEIVDDPSGMEKDSDCMMVLDDDCKETESRLCGRDDDNQCLDDENTTVELEENYGLDDRKGEDNVLVTSVNGWEYFEGRTVKNKSGHAVPSCEVVVSNFLGRSDDDKTRGETEEGYKRKQDDTRKEKEDQDKGCDEAAYDYDAQNSFSKVVTSSFQPIIELHKCMYHTVESSDIGIENELVMDIDGFLDGINGSEKDEGCVVGCERRNKQKEDYDKVTTYFAHMSSQTRSWPSVLRTKDACKVELISKNGNENATKNGEGLGHWKFDTWRWPKRKKLDDLNYYKFKHGKRKFDVWKWPTRKKKRQRAKRYECCATRGAAGLGLICSGHMEEGRSLMGIYFQLNGAGDRYHHFDIMILFSLVLVYANHGKIMGLVHSNHGESIKNFLLEILKMTTRVVIHHGSCLALGLACKSEHERMKWGLVFGIGQVILLSSSDEADFANWLVKRIMDSLSLPLVKKEMCTALQEDEVGQVHTDAFLTHEDVRLDIWIWLASRFINLGDMSYRTLSKYCHELLSDGTSSPNPLNSSKKSRSVAHSTENANVGMVVIKDFGITVFK